MEQLIQVKGSNQYGICQEITGGQGMRHGHSSSTCDMVCWIIEYDSSIVYCINPIK